MHWVLDVNFREDDSRTRERTLGNNLSWLRRFAVTLLKHHSVNDSLRGKMIRCTTAIRSAGENACLKSRSQAIIYCEFVVTSAGSIRTIGMTTTPGELPTDLETCHQFIRELLESLSRQSYLNEKLQHQLEQLRRRIYGRKSEKLDPNQLLLFAREILEATGVDPAVTSPAADAQPVESDSQPDPTKKNGHGRKPLPKSLERRRRVRETITYRILRLELRGWIS